MEYPQLTPLISIIRTHPLVDAALNLSFDIDDQELSIELFSDVIEQINTFESFTSGQKNKFIQNISTLIQNPEYNILDYQSIIFGQKDVINYLQITNTRYEQMFDSQNTPHIFIEIEIGIACININNPDCPPKNKMFSILGQIKKIFNKFYIPIKKSQNLCSISNLSKNKNSIRGAFQIATILNCSLNIILYDANFEKDYLVNLIKHPYFNILLIIWKCIFFSSIGIKISDCEPLYSNFIFNGLMSMVNFKMYKRLNN